MTEATLLLSEIRDLCDRLDEDEMPSPAKLRSVATGARDIASLIDMEQGRELAQAMQDLADAGLRFNDRILDRLRSLQQGRKALKGYGRLRSNKQGQRIRKKA